MVKQVRQQGELRIEIDSHVPWARGVVKRFASQLGFDEKTLTEIDICATELANNLIVHNAKNGKMLFREIANNGLRGIEIEVSDEGPGIADVNKALQGGASSAGSMGQGLPAVQRIAEEFEISSDSNGTTVKIRKFLPNETKPVIPDTDGLVVSVAVRTHPESNVCGDGHVIHHDGPRTLLSVIDGLGHGEKAHHAASAAEAYLLSNFRKPLTQMPREMHAILHKTRGAVAGIAQMDEAQGILDFIGVGNISARQWLAGEKKWVRMVSITGTLGVSFQQPRVFNYRWKKGDLLILHSDGIAENWELSFEERNSHPTKISQILMDKYWQHNDDATVMVAK